MNRTLLRRIIIFLVSVFLLTATILLSSTVVAAQRRGRVVIVRPIRPFDPWYHDRFNRFGYYRQYIFENGDKAYRQGYKDGRNTGQEDGRKEKSYDPERSHYFHDAGFGNFAEAYRQGFSDGYRDAYSNVG
jgi:hypothetical protein